MWGIELNRDGETGLTSQIYHALKAGMLSGQIAAGERMPSTRELAKELGVSRNTVNAAYDRLWTEGFIVSRQGAPSRVAEGLAVGGDCAPRPMPKAAASQPAIRWDFKTGQPDLSAFPWTAWNDAIRHASDSLTASHYAYGGPKGYAPLCEEIAKWLLRMRSMQVDPQDVFITSGSTQALYLLVNLLYRPGRPFAIENPSHPGIRTVIKDRGYPLIYIPVDRQGAEVAVLSGAALSAVYVTPSHQYPLGGILPAGRRAALLRQAEVQDYYIIEDDYDSEFRYTGQPVSPIYSMNASRVIYVGTFSKTLFPALRLGFAVLPKALQKGWRHSRTFLDVQNPVLEQAALAEFLRTRKADKHVRRMRKAYGEKRDIVLDAVRQAFGSSAAAWGDASGLHTALQFPGKRFDDSFAAGCRAAGIRIAPVSQYCADPGAYADTLLIGYGHLPKDRIAAGVQALQSVIRATG